MKGINLWAILFLLSFSDVVRAAPGALSVHRPWGWAENKGQLTDGNGMGLPDVKYYGQDGGVFVFCYPGRIGFVFTKTENISEATGLNGSCRDRARPVSTISANLIFVNANLAAPIVASEQEGYEQNFYLAHTGESGITHIHCYKTITYKSIYPYIDMVLHIKEHGMKYEFVVHPKGKISDIGMQWQGLSGLQMAENGGIRYDLPIAGYDGMVESGPVSYQSCKIIPTRFEKKGQIIGFETSSFSRRKTLIIDPDLSWGTYFGGSAADGAQAIQSDAQGNIYMAGFTNSTSGIATSGAFHSAMGTPANMDAYLAKFDNAGKLLWATYYGGTADEIGFGVDVDHNGNAYLTGWTQSSTGIATKGAFQTSFGGNYDAFLAKFNGKGLLQWSTYYGGANDDYAFAVKTADSGKIYICGYSESNSAIASSGGFKTTNSGGYDAYLAKFDSSGARQWATYFGGTAFDLAYSLAHDTSGNMYISGYTSSSSGIATKGAYQTSYGGGNNDAFVAKFNTSGSLLWATYFGGDGTNTGHIATDKSGNLVLAGSTTSLFGIASTNGYKKTLAGGFDAYVALFNSSGNRLWSTYLGGVNDDEIDAVTTDRYGYIYVAGTTFSSSGIATKGAYQTSLGGGSDVFLAKISNVGIPVWASYYGSGKDEGAFGLVTDSANNVYAAGYTFSMAGIATSGAYQGTNGGNKDAFLLKFGFDYRYDAGVTAIPSPKGILCSGPSQVQVDITNYGSKELDSLQIGWSIVGKDQLPHIWKGKLKHDSTALVALGSYDFPAGNDTVKAWTKLYSGIIDSVPENDTTYIIYKVNPTPAALTGKSAEICLGDSLLLGAKADSGNTYSWTSRPAGFSSAANQPKIAPNANTVYYLTETDTKTGCIGKDSVRITVNKTPIPKWNLHVSGDQVDFHASDSLFGPTAYTWKFGDGDSAFGHLARHVFPKNQSYHVRLTIVSQKGCTSEFDSTINVTESGVDVTNPDLFSLRLSPNPFHGRASFSYHLQARSRILVRLLDQYGQQILVLQDRELWPGNYEMHLDGERYHLSPGIYLLQITADEGTRCLRMVYY